MKRTALPLLLLLPLANFAMADDSSAYLFGDWQGERERLATDGILLKAGYTSEDFNNLRGGDKQSTVHAGQLTLGSQLDLEKLWGIRGAQLNISITYRDGKNIDTKNGVDTLLQPQEIYGRDQTWRLTELWWGQELFDDHLKLKIGRLTVGNEFGDVECVFLYQGLCSSEPGNINGDYWYNWPISQWAIVGQVQFDTSHYLKLGAYQVNPALLDRSHKFTLNPDGTTGALFPVEFGWTPKFAEDLPGTYKVGAWYTNIHRADVYHDVNGEPAAISGLSYRMRDGAYGGYFTFEQQLTNGDRSSSKSGLRLFINATESDRRTSTVDQTLGIGAIYAGLFPSRAADEIGLGLSALSVNHRATANESILYHKGVRAAPPDHDEYAVEMFYNWHIAGWLSMQPEVQWVHHPGQTAANQGNITMFAVKTSIAF